MVRVSKVLSLVIVLCMVLTLLMSGCASKSDNPASQDGQATQGEKKAEGQKKVTIRLFSRQSGDSPIAVVQKKIIDKFMQKYPNVTVLDESISDEASYNNKFKADIAAGNPPHIFFYAGIASLVPYAKSGLIMDVAPLLEDKAWASGFPAGSIELFDLSPYGVKGIYSIPWSLNVEPFFYNVQLFEKAGITKAPETWPQFMDCIKKLKDAGIVPLVVGGKTTWRVGHIHTGLLYKWCGVQKAKDLGLRKAKWTDPDVVQTFQYVLDLKNAGAFQNGFEGMDYESEKTMFHTGKAAMTFDGAWRVGQIPSELKVKTFRMPYFTEKAQFQFDDITYPTQWLLSGKMQGAEKQATIDFVKFWTSKEMQQLVIDEAKRPPARKDVDLSEKVVGPLMSEVLAHGNVMKVRGHDSFAYDPVPSVEQRSKDALIGMLLGMSPADACKQVQDEIDKSK